MKEKFKIKRRTDWKPDLWIEPESELERRGRIAENIMSRLALVTCEFDGYDESGRQKMRLMTPIEVVQRSCDLAEVFIDEAEKRGWILQAESVDKDDFP